MFKILALLILCIISVAHCGTPIWTRGPTSFFVGQCILENQVDGLTTSDQFYLWAVSSKCTQYSDSTCQTAYTGQYTNQPVTVTPLKVWVKCTAPTSEPMHIDITSGGTSYHDPFSFTVTDPSPTATVVNQLVNYCTPSGTTISNTATNTYSFVVTGQCLIFSDAGCTTDITAGGTAPSTNLVVYFKCPTVDTNNQIATTTTDSNGNSFTASTNVFSVYPEVSLTKGATRDSCYNGATGTANVVASGGTGTYSYSWSPAPGSGAGTASIAGLSAQDYTVTVTSGFSTKSLVFTISQPTAALALAPTTVDVDCNGRSTGSATVTATGGGGGYTYAWETETSPNTWQSRAETTDTISGLAPGRFRVTVVDSLTCSDTLVFTVAEPTVLVLTNQAQTNVKCNGGNDGSATVLASGGNGGYTYQWDVSSSTTATASSLQAGTATVTVKDSKQCQDTLAFTITQPAAPLSLTHTQTNVDCNGASTGAAQVTVAGGTVNYQYAWTGAGVTSVTTNSVSNIAAGAYSVQITDANNCVLNQAFTITETAPISVTPFQDNVVCHGDATGTARVQVQGGAGGYSYSWSNTPTPSTVDNVAFLPIGTYRVTVTDSLSCVKTQDFTITEPPLLVVTSAQHTDVNCYGDATGLAKVAVQGGVSGYTYSWDTSSSTTDTASNLVAGTITATVTDSHQCKKTLAFAITQPAAALSIQASSKVDVRCYGETTGMAQVTIAGGSPGYSYSWTGSSSVASSASSLVNGSYTVTATDSKMCTISESFTITQPPTPFALGLSSEKIKCFDGTTSATALPSGGTGPYTFAWSPITTSEATIEDLPSGLFVVTASDSCSVSKIKTLYIPQPSALIIFPAQTNVKCNGDNSGAAMIYPQGGTPPYTYVWSGNVSNSSTANDLVAGVYTVTVSDANGCSQSVTYTITEPDPIVITDTVQPVLCHGLVTGSAAVSVTGGTHRYTYIWAGLASSSNSIANVTAGSYSVRVSDSDLCVATHAITIPEPTLLVVSKVNQKNVQCKGGNTGSASVKATGGTAPYKYVWTSSASTTAEASNLVTGPYTVTVTDANGCSQTAFFLITEPVAALSVTVSTTDNVCNGGNTGSATAVIVGGTAPYSLVWSNSSNTNETVSDLAAGNYTLTVYDANNCMVATLFNISEPEVFCQNNGTCTGNNTCSCPAGYAGADCSEAVAEEVKQQGSKKNNVPLGVGVGVGVGVPVVATAAAGVFWFVKKSAVNVDGQV